jgi:hypothetical protein
MNCWTRFGGVQLLMGNSEVTIMSARRVTGALSSCAHLGQNPSHVTRFSYGVDTVGSRSPCGALAR